jgi:hypothetical protein
LEHQKEIQHSSKDISFHLATSDKELAEKVSSIMKRNGHLTFSDSMGYEHYIVDGRNGLPFLSRNIDNAAKEMFDKNNARYGRTEEFNYLAVDKVLESSAIPNHLKGFRYLKHILNRLMEDDTLFSPISKTLYPEISAMYKSKNFQIDRDIRYAISKSIYIDQKLSPKALIASMLDDAQLRAMLLSTSAKQEEIKNPRDRNR